METKGIVGVIGLYEHIYTYIYIYILVVTRWRCLIRMAHVHTISHR